MILGMLWPSRKGHVVVEDLGSLTHEPEEEYRSKSQDHLDSEQLGDFRRDAFLFHKRQQGLLPDQSSNNGCVGRAAAVRILWGGQRYEAEFAIGGPVNPRTGEPYGRYSPEFEQWAKEQDKPVLSHEQAELIEHLDFSVRSHRAVRDLLAEGIAHGVVRCTYRDVPCQARFDWVNPQRGIVGLVICDSISRQESHFRCGGPVHELAFQRAILAQVTGAIMPVHIVAVETYSPHRCGIWHVCRGLLNQAQKENEDALARLKRCRELDHWPSGYEQVRTLAPIGF